MLTAEVLTAGGILALIALLIRQLFSRIISMEKRHREALYEPNGQPIYVPAANCICGQRGILDKFDNLETMIKKMDAKREQAKDEMARNHLNIETRLTRIETKIGNGNGNGRAS